MASSSSPGSGSEYGQTLAKLDEFVQKADWNDYDSKKDTFRAAVAKAAEAIDGLDIFSRHTVLDLATKMMELHPDVKGDKHTEELIKITEADLECQAQTIGCRDAMSKYLGKNDPTFDDFAELAAHDFGKISDCMDKWKKVQEVFESMFKIILDEE